jgi:hypothetical protein
MHLSWLAAPQWGLCGHRWARASFSLLLPPHRMRICLGTRRRVPPARGRPGDPDRLAALAARRMVDEIVWVKMTVNRRMAKSHGYYLQHAKVRALRPARRGRARAP